MPPALRRLVLAGLVLAPAGVPPAQGEPQPPERLDQRRAQALVAHVALEVEQLRGLSFKRAVPVAVVDDAGLRERLLDQLRAYGLEAKLRGAGEVHRLLGLIPPQADAVAALLDAVEEQAGGFYDPRSGGYYLLSDVPLAAASMYTAHELVHALEDQHHDLDRNMSQLVENDDLAFAVSAVQEGSATLLMDLYTTRAMYRGEIPGDVLETIAATEAGRGAKLAALPPVLQRLLLGPYVLGPRFLAPALGPPSLSQTFPRGAVDQAYAAGPLSSEQILHPEKYWGTPRDVPRPVQLGDAGKLLGPGFVLEHRGVLGEISLGALVGAPTPLPLGAPAKAARSSWTNAAAAGWGGDRFEVWSREGVRVLLLLTVWDSAADAREFFAALPSRQDWLVRLAGDRVALVAGPAGKPGSRVLSRLLRIRLPEAHSR
jgi:hypothetical protein